MRTSRHGTHHVFKAPIEILSKEILGALTLFEGTMLKITDIARICHEANRAYCESLGDTSQPVWDDAPSWQRESAVNGVHFIQNHPSLGPANAHQNWMEEKLSDGWKLGEKKDVLKKEHPNLVPYEKLPEKDKIKDHLFRSIVLTLSRSSFE